MHVAIRAGPRHRPGVRRPRALARRGPNFLFYMWGVYIVRTGFWGVYILKYINRSEILTLKTGLKSVIVLAF